MSLGYFFYRWVLPGGDWRDFCGSLPGGQKAGVGSFLYRVAVLGYDVSTASLLLAHSDAGGGLTDQLLNAGRGVLWL